MSDNAQYTLIEGIKCYSPDVANAYDDYPDDGFDLTEDNTESSFWVRSRNRLFKKIVFDHMARGRKTRFLEIGCATGDFIRHIAENENLEITGSEIYLKGLLYARRNLPDADFIQFDVTRGGIDEKFDMIVAFDVIEHIENDVTAIKNIKSMLNDEGVLILTVPQHMFLWSNLDEIVKHKRRYSRRELVDKLENNGFSLTRVTSFVFALFPLMLVSRLLDRSGKRGQTEELDLEKRVKFPFILNWMFDHLMRIDEFLIRMGFSLPFGGTLVVVAKK